MSGGATGAAPTLFSRLGDQRVAYASGSIGADGVQQSAAVYPENPVSPGDVFYQRVYDLINLRFNSCLLKSVYKRIEIGN